MLEVLIIGSMTVGITGTVVTFVAFAEKFYEAAQRRSVTKQAWMRVQNHLDAETPRDEYGFLAMLDWAAVADLEHNMGFAHTSESKSYCGRVECWKENQDPVYILHNGYITIESFPELPKEKNVHGRRVDPKQENSRLRNELAARKARGSGYIPASITAEEAGVRGYDSGSQTINELRAMPTEPSQDKWHSEEYNSILPAIEAYRDRREPLILPEGYIIHAHSIPGLLQISSPTGLSVVVETPSASDRRRDEEPFWGVP